MAKYKIEIDLDGCIGAIACIAVADKLWELGKDMKAHIKIGEVVKEGNKEYTIVSDEDIKKAGLTLEEIQESGAVCPVNVIKVTKLED